MGRITAASIRRDKIAAMGPIVPTRDEIVRILEVDRRSVEEDVRLLLKAGRIEGVTPTKPVISDDVAEAIREDYAAMMYIEEIAQKHSVTPDRIRYLCRDINRGQMSTVKPAPKKVCAMTYAPGFISVTYGDDLERASRVQAAHRDAVAKYAAAAMARSAARAAA